MPEETIYKNMKDRGVSRRDFLKLSGLLATAMGLTAVPPLDDSGLPAHLEGRARATRMVAKALETAQRLPVIWLEFRQP